jgi:hypothetical protein
MSLTERKPVKRLDAAIAAVVISLAKMAALDDYDAERAARQASPAKATVQ